MYQIGTNIQKLHDHKQEHSNYCYVSMRSHATQYFYYLSTYMYPSLST